MVFGIFLTDTSDREIPRKLKKAYPYTPSFTQAILGDFDNSVESLNIEATALSASGGEMHLRDGNVEVDLVKKVGNSIVGIEVKSGNIDTEKTAHATKKLGSKSGIILNLDDFKEMMVNGLYLSLILLWAPLLYPDELIKRHLEKASQL
ncbi:hypothetical protein ApAK_05700 [Thermoplasmatales archaeon AK]|nr:hypothetical protein [Thermoplasmatales archaeon AK]